MAQHCIRNLCFSRLPADKFFKEIHEENAFKYHSKAFSSWILLSSLNADNKSVDSTDPEPALYSAECCSGSCIQII